MREISDMAAAGVAGGWQTWYDPSEPTTIDDIYVTGNRLYYSPMMAQLIYFYGYGGTPTGGNVSYGGGGGYPGPTPDCQQTQVEYDATATADPLAQQNAQAFSDGIEEHSDRMRALPTSVTLTLPGETTPFTTGSELRDLWARADFTVTGQTLPPGWGGYSNANGGNPQFEVGVANFGVYMFDQSSRAWYFFHELIHVTEQGQARYDAAYQQWEQRRATDPSYTLDWGQSHYFSNNEALTSGLAADLAMLFGIDVRANHPETHGYAPPGTVTGVTGTLTPDTAGSGPGGGCGS